MADPNTSPAAAARARLDPADLQLPRWLLRLLDALARLRIRLPGSWRAGATRAGLVFTGAWLGVWAAALYSGNNLLYLCASLLTGIALAAILRGVRLLRETARALEAAPLPPATAGREWRHPIERRLASPAIAGVVTLAWRWQPADAHAMDAQGMPPGMETGAGQALAGDGRLRLRLRASAKRRGVFRMAGLTLGTRAPVGLFALEKTLAFAAEWWVLPAPAPWPAALEGMPDARGAHGREQWSDLAGLRAYAPGDSPRRIHWRKAGHAPEDWLVKQFSPQERPRSDTLIVDLRLPAARASDGAPDRARQAFERLLGQARRWLEEEPNARRLVLGAEVFDLRRKQARRAALRALAAARPADTPPAETRGILLRARP